MSTATTNTPPPVLGVLKEHPTAVFMISPTWTCVNVTSPTWNCVNVTTHVQDRPGKFLNEHIGDELTATPVSCDPSIWVVHGPDSDGVEFNRFATVIAQKVLYGNVVVMHKDVAMAHIGKFKPV